jgi:4-amino-4-deoxy-L-arabinose transferase-like glycosyltransferase
MERTLRDDLKWAVVVLAGATLAYFVFGMDDASLLLSFVVGVVVVIAVLNVARRLTPRRKP